eukprot:3005766-Amphidinium_carterae.1
MLSVRSQFWTWCNKLRTISSSRRVRMRCFSGSAGGSFAKHLDRCLGVCVPNLRAFRVSVCWRSRPPRP